MMSVLPPDHLPDFASFPYELEALYATAPVGLCVVDTRFRYLRINQRLAETNGFSVEEHLGRTVRDILPQLADFFEPLFHDIIQTGEAKLNLSVSGETPAQPGVVRHWNEHLLPIKNDAGQVIAIHAVVEEVTERRRSEARFRLLNQAGEVLSSSLEYELTLTRVAQMAVPVIADWCVVDIAADDGTLHRLAITHADPDKQAAAEELKQRYPTISPDARHTLNQVLSSGKTWFDPQISEARLVGEARDADHLRLLRALGFQSEIVVPLAARGKLLGGLTFVYGPSRRRHTPDDVELIEVLARRAALAIDNARLYRAARLARQEAELTATRIYLLQEITSTLSHVRSLPELAEIILNRAASLLGVHLGLVLLRAEDGTALNLAGHSGLSSEALARCWPLPLAARHPATDAVRTRQPVWLESADDHAQQYPDIFRDSLSLRALAALPLFINDRVDGVILFGFPDAHTFDPQERGLLLAIADQCAQTIDRVRLFEKERELIVLEERNRLARELHDAVSQTLTAATVMAESTERIWKKDPDRALGIMNQVARLNHVAQHELRTLLWELRPDTILKNKPGVLLQQLVNIVNGRKGLRAELIREGVDEPLPEPVQIALYRIAQESLNNVVKHSQAARVRVHLSQTTNAFTLRIVDNGRGFDTSQEFVGLGLGTMRERAAAIQARLVITSEPGQGTTTELSWGEAAASV